MLNRQSLKPKASQIHGIEQKVSLPESSWLLAQTVQPFQASHLHPAWCLRKYARVKVEGSPNRKDWHSKQIAVFIGPYLLTRTPQSHENDTRLALLDVGDNVCFLPGRDAAKFRRPGPGYWEARKGALEAFDQAVQGF